MSVNVSKDSGDTTFTFVVTGLSTKLDPVLDKWAEYVWNSHGLIIPAVLGVEEDIEEEIEAVEAVEEYRKPFDEATNQEKLDAINKRLKALGLAEANSQEDKDTHAAKIAEKTVHNLEDID